MKTRTLIGIAVLSLVLISVSGCQYLRKRVEKKEKSEYKLNTKGKIRIEIENLNGNVEVLTTDDTLGYIYMSAEKTGKVKINETDKPIEGVEINVDTTGQVIKVDTDYRKSISIFGNKNENRVNYIIKVPAALQVYVNLSNGKITADKLTGDSKFETVNGSVYINSCSGSLNVESVNGSIMANIDSSKGLTASTVNGTIKIGSLKFANANIDASCVNGKVKSENLNFTNLTSEKHSLSGKLGKGTSIIKLSTVNGSITLDGNYLSFNKKDKVDWNFKFEFDDNDEPVKIKVKHTDEQKGIESNPKDSIKAKDSAKTK